MDKMIYTAMLDATETQEFFDGGYYWPPQYVEKFAKLVVKGLSQSLTDNGCPLTPNQIAVINQHFPEG